MPEIKIIFPTEEAKHIFATWLSCSGEQDYFRAMERSKTPSLRLSYRTEDEQYERNDKRRYGKFLDDNTIRVIVCDEE